MSITIKYVNDKEIKIEPNALLASDVLTRNYRHELHGQISRDGYYVATSMEMPVEEVDESTASEEAKARVHAKIMITQDMLPSIIQQARYEAELNGYNRFVVACPLHHVLPGNLPHYQSLLMYFDGYSKTIRVTMLNSLRWSVAVEGRNKNTQAANITQWARALIHPLELSLNANNYQIVEFEYKEHYIQAYSNSCGPVSLENAKHELYKGGPSLGRKISYRQDQSWRANQQYRLENNTLHVPEERIPEVTLDSTNASMEPTSVVLKSLFIGSLAAVVAIVCSASWLMIFAVFALSTMASMVALPNLMMAKAQDVESLKPSEIVSTSSTKTNESSDRLEPLPEAPILPSSKVETLPLELSDSVASSVSTQGSRTYNPSGSNFSRELTERLKSIKERSPIYSPALDSPRFTTRSPRTP